LMEIDITRNTTRRLKVIGGQGESGRGLTPFNSRR
jgi:hypothetical protein